MKTDITLVNNKDIEYITFKQLDKYKDLVCVFTTKKSSFRIKNEKDISNVENQYKYLQDALKIPKYVVPKQTHSINVASLDDEEGIYPESLKNVDAIVTNKKDILLSLVYADCTPILFYDNLKKVIACVHSGWRGTLNSIVTETIKVMKEKFLCDEKDIICLIGPTIRKCHFEVETDVKDLFYEKYKNLSNINDIISKCRVVDGVKKYNIDTVLLNKTIIKSLGIKDENIYDCEICTYCSFDKFHSHRKEGEISGRCTLAVALKN